jgi:hypothetical protein
VVFIKETYNKNKETTIAGTITKTKATATTSIGINQGHFVDTCDMHYAQQITVKL